MSVGEQHAAGRQAIHVWSLRLWMSSHTTDPVIEIIDGDEEVVGFVGGSGNRVKENEKKDWNVPKVHGNCLYCERDELNKILKGITAISQWFQTTGRKSK